MMYFLLNFSLFSSSLSVWWPAQGTAGRLHHRPGAIRCGAYPARGAGAYREALRIGHSPNHYRIVHISSFYL